MIDCIDRLNDNFPSSSIIKEIITLYENICLILNIDINSDRINKNTPNTNNNYNNLMRKFAFRKCKKIHNYNPFIKPTTIDRNSENNTISSQRIKSLAIELPTLKKESYNTFGESGIRFYFPRFHHFNIFRLIPFNTIFITESSS